MLKLNGTSEQTFASHNSINMNPQVFVEWNYNNIYKPYNVFPSQSTSASFDIFNSTSSFTTSSVTINAGSANYTVGSGIYSASSAYVTKTRTSKNSIRAITASTNASISASSSITGPGYYKLTFYTKTDVTFKTGYTNRITNATFTTASVAGTKYYAWVVPVSESGYRPSFSLTGEDATSQTYASNTKPVLTWTADPNAVEYDIYFSEQADSDAYVPYPKYFKTVTNKDIKASGGTPRVTFTDSASALGIGQLDIYGMFRPPGAPNEISVSPSIKLYNGTSLVDNTTYYVKFYEDENVYKGAIQGSFYPNGVQYNKVEVFFGSESTFTRFDLALNISSTKNTQVVFFDKFDLVPINSWIYDSNRFYPIEEIFQSNRPGEALLNPLNTQTTIANGTKNKPVSYGYYNPDGFDSTDYRKNILNSIYNNFQYYISDAKLQSGTTPVTHYVTAKYDNILTINKLVLKVINKFTSIDSANVYFYNSTGTQISSTSISSSDFNGKEYLTLFYNGTTWSTSGTFNPPQLTDSGLISNALSDVAQIQVTFNVLKNVNPVEEWDAITQNRLHLIELSPRLEIDISPLVKAFNVKKDIDSNQTAAGFPMGYMNSNTATVEISNIPVYNAGIPYTIFDQISENATFKDLLREGVKFSLNLVSPQQDFTEKIPAFVMYANRWGMNGISNVSVDLYDFAKYSLMSIPAPQYSGYNEPVFDTIVNIMSGAGFSDFDYDQLKSVLLKSAKNTTYFWTDLKGTLFESLQSFFVSHQIGAWFDEYGVLKFKSIRQIIQSYMDESFQADFAVTDKTLDRVGTSSVTYIPNLLDDGFNHDINPIPGKIIFNYKVPSTNMEQSASSIGVGSKQQYRQTGTGVWGPKEMNGIFSTRLDQELRTGQNEFYISTDVLNTATNSISDYSGQGFINGEIISYNGIEYDFWCGKADIDDGSKYKAIIRNEGDAELILSQLKAENPDAIDLYYEPTGKFVGVERGKYGTQERNHLRFLSQAKDGYTLPDNYFYFKETSNGSRGAQLRTANPTPQFTPVPESTLLSKKGSVLSLNAQNPRSFDSRLKNISRMIVPKFNAKDCTYFAVEFSVLDKITSKYQEVGIYLDQGGDLSSSSVSTTNPLYIGLKFNASKTEIVVGNNSVQLTSTGAKPSFTKLDRESVTSLPISMKISKDKTYRFSFLLLGTRIAFFNQDGELLASAKINYPSGNLVNFGTYYYNYDSENIGVAVSEIYATEWQTLPTSFDIICSEILSNRLKYHFSTRNYLNNVVQGIPNTNNYYMWTSELSFKGLSVYQNRDLEYTPCIPGTFQYLKVYYDPDAPQQYRDENGKLQWMPQESPYHSVKINDISYSDICASPFRTSMAMVNNSDQMIFISTDSGKIGEVPVTPLGISAVKQTLSKDNNIEKIINSQNIKETIQMDSPWVQSKKDAEELVELVQILSKTFNGTISAKIFGNPLIQIGDFCQVVYSLKNIGYDRERGIIPRYFFVKSISHNYSDGFDTELILKPMFGMS